MYSPLYIQKIVNIIAMYLFFRLVSPSPVFNNFFYIYLRQLNWVFSFVFVCLLRLIQCFVITKFSMLFFCDWTLIFLRAFWKRVFLVRYFFGDCFLLLAIICSCCWWILNFMFYFLPVFFYLCTQSYVLLYISSF